MIYEGEIYGTPSRPRAGTAEKKGSPLKLEELREVDNLVYDVTGKENDVIRALLDSAEGDHLEWYNGKIMVKVEGGGKDYAAKWIVATYEQHLENAGWEFGRTTHVPGPDRAFIPDGIAFYIPHRQRTRSQLAHAMTPQPAPHFALEVEVESEVDRARKGFHKVLHGLFPMRGQNDTRIEEAWVVVLPNEPTPAPAPVPVVALPVDQQPVIQPQHERPPAGTCCYLAILRRADPPPPDLYDQIQAYYPLLPNTRFAVPNNSLFSHTGPAGAPGVPPLVVNTLLRMLRHIVLVAQPLEPPQQVQQA